MEKAGIVIRPERREDYRDVENMIRDSFWNVYRPGCSEHYVIHVLRDASCRKPPLAWAAEVVELYRELDADLVAGEVNNGGDLIESLLRQLADDLNFRAVHATRGKILRAEPVAALYSRGKVRHAGEFPDLEDEMLGYSPLVSTKSPDRLDALVWAVSELARPVGGVILA